MEHVFAILGLGVLAGVITVIGNALMVFGAPVIAFLVIWAVLLVLAYGGFFFFGDMDGIF